MAEHEYVVVHPINFGRNSERGRWARDQVVVLDEEEAAEFSHALVLAPERAEASAGAGALPTGVGTETGVLAPRNSGAGGTTGTPEQALVQPGHSTLRPDVISDSQAAARDAEAIGGEPEPALTATSEDVVPPPPVTGGSGAAAESDGAPVDATEGARTRARELGVDLSEVTGTLENGRIQAPDVDKFHQEQQG